MHAKIGERLLLKQPGGQWVLWDGRMAGRGRHEGLNSGGKVGIRRWQRERDRSWRTLLRFVCQPKALKTAQKWGELQSTSSISPPCREKKKTALKGNNVTSNERPGSFEKCLTWHRCCIGDNCNHTFPTWRLAEMGQKTKWDWEGLSWKPPPHEYLLFMRVSELKNAPSSQSHLYHRNDGQGGGINVCLENKNRTSESGEMAINSPWWVVYLINQSALQNSHVTSNSHPLPWDPRHSEWAQAPLNEEQDAELFLSPIHTRAASLPLRPTEDLPPPPLLCPAQATGMGDLPQARQQSWNPTPRHQVRRWNEGPGMARRQCSPRQARVLLTRKQKSGRTMSILRRESLFKGLFHGKRNTRGLNSENIPLVCFFWLGQRLIFIDKEKCVLHLIKKSTLESSILYAD